MSYIHSGVNFRNRGHNFTVSTDTSNMVAGQMMFDPDSGWLQVFDGESLQFIDVAVNSTLDPRIASLLEWANRQQHGQFGNDMISMAYKYPLVMEAIHQLDVAMALCKNLENE